MSAALAEVVHLSDNSMFQQRMLARVSCHGGFNIQRIGTSVREVLRIKGKNIPLDWLVNDVCVYYRTPHYLYLGIVENVMEVGEWILLICLNFTTVVVDEDTPELQRGTSLATLSTRDVRLLDGKPIDGCVMYPSLPS